MEYKGMPLEQAMDVVVNDKLIKLNGEGGMIGVDAAGNCVMIFNSAGMYRAMRSSDGQKEVAIYR
jgi:beta-aspartyl-peptidase (threonine type)